MSQSLKTIKQYKEAKIVSFSVDIKMEWSEKNQKFQKVTEYPRLGYASYDLNTPAKELHDAKFNSLAIRCGEISGIFVVDVDNLEGWKNYLKEKNKKCPKAIKAVTAKGFHMYFKYEKKQEIIKSTTGLFGCYDIRGNKSIVFSPGSTYIHKSLDEEGNLVQQLFTYYWKTENTILNSELPLLPDWLYDDIVDWQAKHNSGGSSIKPSQGKTKQQIINPLLDPELQNVSNIDCDLDFDVDQLHSIVKLYKAERSDDFTTWRNVGLALASTKNNNNFSVFDEFSKSSTKYNSNEVKKSWKGFMKCATPETPLTYRSLMYWASIDSPDEFAVLLRKLDIKKEKTIQLKNTYHFTQEYLNDSDILKLTTDFFTHPLYNELSVKTESYKPKKNDDSNTIESNLPQHLYYKYNLGTYQITPKQLSTRTDPEEPVEDFKRQPDSVRSAEPTKLLLLKSNYGTGKTTLLSKFIGPQISKDLEWIMKGSKKVLFITYRISLANSLHGTFPNFSHYKSFTGKKTDKITLPEKLIIQVDSLYKINTLDDNQYYDYVILDESESILNHFSATTLKNPSATYMQLLNLCKKATRVVLMDGDISNRSKVFSKQVVPDDRILFINNTYNKIKYNFLLTSDETEFLSHILEDIKVGKNIAIICMSKIAVEKYYKAIKINSKCSMVKYTSDTSEKDKEKLKDVNNEWVKHQVVIYNPTIESGVSFDVKHFDKLYISVYSSNTLQYACCSERALFQMMCRIRHFKENDVLVYKGTLKINENFKPISVMAMRYTFKDMYDQAVDDAKQFKQILPYNKAEEFNKLSYGFLFNFRELALDKGHTLRSLETGFKMLPSIRHISNETIANLDISNYTPIENVKDKKQFIEVDDDKLLRTKYFISKEFNMEFKTVKEIEKYFHKINYLDNFKNLNYYLKTGKFPDIANATVSVMVQRRSLEILIKLFELINPKWLDEYRETGRFSISNAKIVSVHSEETIIKATIENDTEILEEEKKSNNVREDIGKFLCQNLRFFGLTGKKQFKSWKDFLGSFNSILECFLISTITVEATTRKDRSINRREVFVTNDEELYSAMYSKELNMGYDPYNNFKYFDIEIK